MFDHISEFCRWQIVPANLVQINHFFLTGNPSGQCQQICHNSRGPFPCFLYCFKEHICFYFVRYNIILQFIIPKALMAMGITFGLTHHSVQIWILVPCTFTFPLHFLAHRCITQYSYVNNFALHLFTYQLSTRPPWFDHYPFVRLIFVFIQCISSVVVSLYIMW